MNELKVLQQRQQLLEQAARLQRATIVVRLHKLQENRLSLYAGSAWRLLQRFYVPSGRLMVAWKIWSWFTHKKSR